MTFQADKFRQLIEAVEKEPDERFSMTMWARETSCGMVRCAGGLAALVFPTEVELFRCGRNLYLRHTKSGRECAHAMAELLGIPECDADELFVGTPLTAGSRTRAQQVAVMRHYLAAHQETV